MNNVQRTERALTRAIIKAQRMGFVIIWGAFSREMTPDERPGVCAMGAANLTGARLAFPRRAYDMCRAYDAIEAGFDGEHGERLDNSGRPLPKKWRAVGERLRERFQPRWARL